MLLIPKKNISFSFRQVFPVKKYRHSRHVPALPWLTRPYVQSIEGELICVSHEMIKLYCFLFMNIALCATASAFSLHNGRFIRLNAAKLRMTPADPNRSELVSSSTVGVIIVDHGSRVDTANQMLIDLVARYKKANTRVRIVEAAHMEMCEPSIKTAFARCVEQGATEVICHPYFLSRGRHVLQDIPSLMAEAADEHKANGVKYTITEPLGLHSAILDIIDSCISEHL